MPDNGSRAHFGTLLTACLIAIPLSSDPVAQIAQPVTGLPAADGGTVAATWFEAQIEVDAFVDTGDWPAAANAARHLLDVARSELGEQSRQLALLQVTAASVFSRNDEFELAERTVQQALDYLTEVDGRYAASMIDPYLVLGDNYQAAGDHLAAMSAYGEARTTSRRVNGVINVGQIDIIERMSATAASLGQLNQAHSLQVEARTIVERNFEPHAPETLAAIYRYAAWLRERNLYTAEREQYSRIARIVRRQHGDEHPLLVPMLRERANSLRTQGVDDAAGIAGLREALAILAKHPDGLSEAEVLRDIGDWEAAFGRSGTDGMAYRNAWELLANVDDGARYREDWFGRNFIVLAGPLDRERLSSAGDDPEGNVLLTFIVDANGLTHDVSVASASPAGLKDEAFAEQFRNSRFRPMLIDGEPVATRRTYDVRFRYREAP